MKVTNKLLLLAVLFALSCGKETTRPQTQQQQQQLVANDTPQHTVQRFIGAYEQKKAAEYADLFTGDFSYEFSNSTDPDLVTKYSTGWFTADEVASSSHLFHGYTPQGQPHAPAASSINLEFANTAPVDDGGGGIDPATHKFLFTRVDAQIVIPTSPDPTNFLIENNTNIFYLVRGDHALELTASQPADSTHWYVYRWVDITTASASPGSPDSPLPSSPATWGKVKGLYR